MLTKEDYLSAGLDLQNQSRWQEAAEQYQRAIELSPDCAQSNYQLGCVWSKLNRMDVATPYLETACKSAPESCLFHTSLGAALRDQGKRSEAIEAFKRGIELEPLIAENYHSLGDLLLGTQRFQEAKVAYENAIALKIGFSWTHHNLGKALFKLGRFQDALPHFRNAIKIHPDRSVYYLSLAEALASEKLTDEAAEAYTQAIRLEPRNPDVHCKLGEHYNAHEQWEEAIPCFVESIRYSPQFLRAYRPLALALRSIGSISDVEQERFSEYLIPDHIAESLFGAANIAEVGLESDEFDCLASKDGENLVLSPKTVSSFNLKPSDTNTHYKFLEHAKVPPAYLLDIKDGRAWGDGLNSAVLTASGKLIQNVSTRNSKVVAGISQYHPAKKIEGNVAFFSHHLANSDNYFHWLFFDIARFHMLELAGIEISSIDKFVFARARKDYYLEILEVLGIPQSKVVESIVEPHISADRLLVPSPTHPAWGTSKWACKYLRDIVMDSISEEDRKNNVEKIYISRSSAPCRRIINEEELIPILKDHGFEIVKLEEYSIHQKAALLSSAKVVISPHGAGLANMVFCNPGTKVIEIFPECVMDSVVFVGLFSVIAHQCYLDHHYLVGEEAPVKNETRPPAKRDIFIDAAMFKKVLSEY